MLDESENGMDYVIIFVVWSVFMFVQCLPIIGHILSVLKKFDVSCSMWVSNLSNV